MIRTHVCLSLALLLASSMATVAHSAEVTTFGTASAPQSAEVMRLGIIISGVAKTPAEALENLQNLQAKVTERVKALGADEKSIVFSAPSVRMDQSGRAQQMQMMIQQHLARGGRVPPGITAAEMTTLDVTLTADWPLSSGDAAQNLLKLQELQEKIKAADLAETAEQAKQLPEAQELAEEFESTTYYGGEEQAKPGTPQFVFISRPEEAARTAVMQSAFKNAETEANRIATATGRRLGKLQSLNAAGGNEQMSSMQAYQMMRYGMRGDGAIDFGLEDNEISSNNPTGIPLRAFLTATFALEE